MPDVVLVIHDDPFLLAALGEALSTEHTTPVLSSGGDALQRLHDGTAPDVIVVDLDMRDAGALLVELEGAMEDAIPVVALGSQPGRLLEAGVAEAVLMKPFEAEQLLGCVHRACEQPRGAV